MCRFRLLFLLVLYGHRLHLIIQQVIRLILMIVESQLLYILYQMKALYKMTSLVILSKSGQMFTPISSCSVTKYDFHSMKTSSQLCILSAGLLLAYFFAQYSLKRFLAIPLLGGSLTSPLAFSRKASGVKASALSSPASSNSSVLRFKISWQHCFN